MTQSIYRERVRELVVGVATASVAALALYALGLSEVIWAPFFFVAAASSRRARCFGLRRGSAGL